jgi:hypothetical protein
MRLEDYKNDYDDYEKLYDPSRLYNKIDDYKNGYDDYEKLYDPSEIPELAQEELKRLYNKIDD